MGLIFLLWGAAGQINAEPPEADSPKQIASDEESALAERPSYEQSMQRYLEQIGEIERRAQQIVEDAIREARQKADELKEQESAVVRAEFVEALNEAIARAVKNGDLDRAVRLTKERDALDGQTIPAPGTDPTQFVDNEIYECVLGMYGQFTTGKHHQVINLAVPNRNL